MTNLDLDKKLTAIIAQDSSLFGKSLREIDDSFLKGPYSKIHKLLKSYYTKHQRLPTLDLIEEQIFKNKKKIFDEQVDADKFILNLRQEATLIDAQDYDFLLDEVRKRKGYDIIHDLLPKAVESAKEDNIVDAAELLISAGNSMKATIANDRLERTSNHDYVDTILSNYDKTKEDPEIAWGFKTGFKKLDLATFGLSRGEMFIISARPGNGKSMFLLSVATNMFRNGQNVLYVSIEMPTEQMWHRAAACYSGFEINEIKEGRLGPEREQLFKQEMQVMKSRPNRFEILDAPNVTVPTIAAEIEQMIDEHKPDVVFVDYLGIVRPTEKGLQDNLAQASVVEELRALGRQKKVGMFSAVQLNRDSNKNKTKGLERLARSDVIGATSDCVLQIEEFDTDEELTKISDRVSIIAIKNRKGLFPFSFDVKKNFKCAQFVDWDLVGWGGEISRELSSASSIHTT